jgi:DNA-binding NarL/FixJ family response regulator
MGITILVADDQPLMRAALRVCLAAEPDLTVVGEAADGQDAVELAERLKPNVLIMDIRMPRMDGVTATRHLLAGSGGSAGSAGSAGSGGSGGNTPVRVLALTTFDLDEYVVEALRAGASGFLLKDATPEELVHAVRVIAGGEALLAPSVTRRLLDRYAYLLPVTPRTQALVARLTARELAVLKILARGSSNAEIGQAMHLAESSVKSHISHLLAKLGLTGRIQLVVFAYETGLVQPGWADAVPRPRDASPEQVTGRQPTR